MKISLWTIGKPHEPYVKHGIEEYSARLSRYYPTEWKIIPQPRQAASMSEEKLKKAEAESILAMLGAEDHLVLLDERGKMLDSVQLARMIQDRANESVKNLVFLIGGAYGVDAMVWKRANMNWSLSPLTFPHQLVRLVLAEQLYRACTILRNEPYHHR
jgi:23S rRNA (pseudouridine1915-N3)-methyltransferase